MSRNSDHASARRRFPAISLDLNSLYCLVLRTERSGPTKSFQRAVARVQRLQGVPPSHVEVAPDNPPKDRTRVASCKSLSRCTQRPANLPEDSKYDARPRGSEVVQTGVGGGGLT